MESESVNDQEATMSETTYWTVRDLCRICHVSHDAVTRMLRDPLDPIPSLRMGRRFLFRPDAVEKWMARRAKRTTPRYPLSA